MLSQERKYLPTQGVNYVMSLKETTQENHKNKAAVREDDDEIRVHVRVKIKPDVMENAVRANAPVDANVQHALATADVLNPAAPRNANLVVTDAGVKYDYTK